MNRLLKLCLFAAFILLMIPFAASAAESDLESVAVQLENADSIDSQLALINDAAETFSDILSAGGWDISLNCAPAGELPDGLLPETYHDDPQYAEEFPEELKEGKILALYDDEGTISLLGDFMARLSPDRRAASLDEADIMLIVRHEDVARTDYIGSAYNRDYFGYMWRIDTGDIYQIFNQVNTPPVSGMGTLYGDSMSKQELWDRMRFDFFSSKVITEADGTTTTYTLMQDGWSLSGLEGDRQVLEVPGEIDGYPVAAISYSLSYECPSLQQVILNEGVKTIEDGIFQNLHSLTEVTLPEGLTHIGEYAFNGCDALAELHIPDSVESIGNNAFSSMTALAELKLPAAPVDLGSGVITGFNRIGSLALPEGLTQLPEGCFSGSYGLTALYIPASVVNFPESIPDWIVVCTPQGSPAQMWADKLGLTVAACDSADDMPQMNVEQEDQFYYVIYNDEATLVNTDPDVQYVNIPDTFGEKPLTAIRYAFHDDNNVVYISIPEGVTSIGNDFCYSCDYLEQIVLPSSLEKIGDNAFYYCTALTELVLPDGLQNIGRSFASSCYALTSVTLPSALTEISDDFMYDTGLASLVIPDGVRKLPAGALSGCDKLFSLYLPASVVQIDATLPEQVTIFAPEGSPALMWAESNGYVSKALEDPSQMPIAERFEEGDLVYYLYDGEALFGSYIGDGQELVIPETLGGAPVTRILSYAIPSDTLTSITVADSVRRIDSRAFNDNDYLEELYLPGTIEYMDEGAISGIYHDCIVYTPEGSYPWDFVSQNPNCSGGHVFTLENWEHESHPVEKAETSDDTGAPEDNTGFFPDLDDLMPKPLLTYGNFAGTDPDESTTLDDGSIRQTYLNVTKDDYSAYGNALGNEGYTIVDSSTEGSSVHITIAREDTQFTMNYDPGRETMIFIFPADAYLG